MKLSALYVHPIKSCGAVRLERASLDARGLRHDRAFMVVDGAGEFVTQRQLPAMARVRCALAGEQLELEHDRAGRFELSWEQDGPRVEVRVWGDGVEALVCLEASDYLSEALGRPLRLVRMPEDAARVANPARAGEGHAVSFADGYPLLLTSEASLAELERWRGATLDMRRFRPNLVIDGDAPWVEEELASFRLGGVPMRSVKPCERCSVITVDPDSGERGVEPMKSLAAGHRVDGKVLFGVNVVHDGLGELKVGDELEPV